MLSTDLDFLDDGPSPVLDVTESEMFLFPAVIIQMGHDTSGNLMDCWLTAEQFFSPKEKTVGHDRFLHFSNSDSDVGNNGLDC